MKPEGVTTILPQQEIIYIEVQSHHLYVHTQKEVLKVRGKISDFAYLAETGDFFMSTLFLLM
ncbi:MAG: LytTR family transcriptional regulator DNA-binding domain-containing protein [Lachnospira sp.]